MCSLCAVGTVCLALSLCGDNIISVNISEIWAIHHHHHRQFLSPILNICIQYIMSCSLANMLFDQYNHQNCTRQGHLDRLGFELWDGCHPQTRTFGMR